MELIGESTEVGSRVFPATEILFTPPGKLLVETTIVGFLGVSPDKKPVHETPIKSLDPIKEFKGFLGGLSGYLFGSVVFRSATIKRNVKRSLENL